MTPQLQRLPGGEGKYHAVVAPIRDPRRTFVLLIEKRRGVWWLEATGPSSRRRFMTLRALRGYVCAVYIDASQPRQSRRQLDGWIESLGG